MEIKIPIEVLFNTIKRANEKYIQEKERNELLAVKILGYREALEAIVKKYAPEKYEELCEQLELPSAMHIDPNDLDYPTIFRKKEYKR